MPARFELARPKGIALAGQRINRFPTASQIIKLQD